MQSQDVARTALRFRRDLGQPVDAPVWPTGFSCRTLLPGDAAAVHALLKAADLHGPDLPDPEGWWTALTGDSEFEAALCFVALDAELRIVGVAQCWTSAFLKDLAVHPEFRRLGIGECLLGQVFCAFRACGASHLDLKVDVGNAAAIRLYERAGMRQVPLAG